MPVLSSPFRAGSGSRSVPAAPSVAAPSRTFSLSSPGPTQPLSSMRWRTDEHGAPLTTGLETSRDRARHRPRPISRRRRHRRQTRPPAPSFAARLDAGACGGSARAPWRSYWTGAWCSARRLVAQRAPRRRRVVERERSGRPPATWASRRPSASSAPTGSTCRSPGASAAARWCCRRPPTRGRPSGAARCCSTKWPTSGAATRGPR